MLMTLRSTIDSLLLWLEEKQTEYGIKQKTHQSRLKDELVLYKKSATSKDFVLLGFAIGFVTCLISLSLMGVIR